MKAKPTYRELEKEIEALRNDLEHIKLKKTIKSESKEKSKAKVESDSIESAARFISLIESGENSIWSIDTNYNYLIFNQFFKKAYQKTYNIELAKGKNALELLSTKLKEFWKAKYDQVLGGEKMVFEFDEIIENERQFFEVHLNPIILKLKVVGVSAISTNVTDRKRNEKLILKERNLAQKYLDIAGVMMIVINLKGVVTLANKKACAILGYKEEEILGKNWFEHFIPDRFKKEVLPVSKKLLSGDFKVVETFENKILTKSGEERLIDWKNTVLKDEQGNIIAHLSSGEDITDRRKIEQALLESQNELNTILNAFDDGVYLCSSDYEILYLNPAMQDKIGYDAVGQNCYKSIYKVNEPCTWCYFDDLTKEKRKTFIEVELNGRNYIVSSVLLKNRTKLSVYHDITKIRKAEQEIRNSEAKYKSLYEQAPLPYQSLDEDGCFIDVNPAWLKTLGYERDEVLGKWYGSILHPDYVERFKKNFPVLKEKGEVTDVHFELKKKNGEYIHININGCSSYGPNNVFQKTYCVFSDITNEQKAFAKLVKSELDLNKQNEKYKVLNIELTIAKEKAEESNRLKTEFLNNISHEVRTPMNGILGFSNQLKKPNISFEKQKNYVDIISSSTNQLLQIIDDIIEISSLETKQVTVSEKEVCINDLLVQLFSVFDIKAKENKIPLYLKKSLSDEASTIIIDASMFTKALGNLLDNAIRFTNEGFVEFGYRLISVKTKTLKSQREKKETLGPQDITIVKKPVELQFFIKDTGIGIEPEKHKLIFERFSQENVDVARDFGGLGLGLSIAKENIKLLGGDISLKSEKGKGSTFFVTIPYKLVNIDKKTNQPKYSDTISSSDQVNKKYTVLVVEDENLNHLYFEALLEDIDFNISALHAENGQEAVEMCEKNSKIDLVLMDLKMPVMNGFEASRQIKLFRPELPIIAQTAYSTKSDREKALKAGCDEFISKPISEDSIVELIRSHLL